MAHGKKYRATAEKIKLDELYALDAGVKLVKGGAKAKYDETIEIALNLGIDPRHADQQVRGVVNLPGGTGKTVRVVVFARGDKADAAKTAGASVRPGKNRAFAVFLRLAPISRAKPSPGTAKSPPRSRKAGKERRTA